MLYDLRQKGDYAIDIDIEKIDAQKQLEKCKDFIDEIDNLMKKREE